MAAVATEAVVVTVAVVAEAVAVAVVAAAEVEAAAAAQVEDLGGRGAAIRKMRMGGTDALC